MSLISLFRRSDGRLNPVGFIAILVSLISVALIARAAVVLNHKARLMDQKSRAVQAELEGEFRAIKPVEGATALSYHSVNDFPVLVSDSYRTNLSYTQVRTHYDAELSKRGWSFYLEEPLTEWGKDLGGKEAHYCKGPYRAGLQWAGERANDGFDYAFSLSWGLGDTFPTFPEAFYKAGCK